MSDKRTSSTVTVDNYDSDAWLRGYFQRASEAVNLYGAKEPGIGVWKNIDFLRLRDVALHLLEPRSGTRILDIGCANGPTMVYCGLQGAEVFGQDLDEGHVRDANALLKRFGLSGRAVVGDARHLQFEDGFFDGVISSDFTEHVTDDVKVAIFDDARRVLKPGGVLITKTPNLRYLQASLLLKRARELARFRNPMKVVIPHTPGTEDPQHIGLTHRWGLTRSLRAAGFLNYQFYYAPLRRIDSAVLEVLSTEVPMIRDILCEDLFCRAYKPIVLSHFPD